MTTAAPPAALPANCGVALASGRRLSSQLGRLGLEATVASDDGAGRQVELAPPDDVGEVAEGADHGDAGALLGLGELVGHDRDLDAEDRGGDRGAEQRLVALVVGVGDEGDAADQQLGPGGRDMTIGSPPSGRRNAMSW